MSKSIEDLQDELAKKIVKDIQEQAQEYVDQDGYELEDAIDELRENFFQDFGETFAMLIDTELEK